MTKLTSINFKNRRTIINGGMCMAASSIIGCTSTEPKNQIIELDVTDVDSIPKLIQAIRKAAGGRNSNSMADTDFISEFARIFVENARAAAEHGFKIPEWVLEKLPNRKVVFPALGIIIFTAYGIKFIIPLGTIIAATLGSLGIMTIAILAAINAMLNTPKKA